LSKAFSDANRKSVIAEKEPVKEKKSNIYYYLPKEIRQLITLMINLFFKFLKGALLKCLGTIKRRIRENDFAILDFVDDAVRNEFFFIFSI
jgi:hypothetical protein